MSLDTSSGTQEYEVGRRDTVLSVLSTQDPIYKGEGSVGGSIPKIWEAASFEQHGPPLLKTWWPVLLSVILAVLFTLSLCYHSFGSSLSGIRLRRLGGRESEEEGDLPIPPSPDLAELCHSLGDWTPDFPSHGGPRASPDLVEAVLASVDWTPDFPSHGGPRASPDLVEAVLASVEGTPEFPSHGGPRASPDLVEAVLASVEAEDESGGEAASQPALATFDSSVETFVSGTGVKRLLPEEDSSEAESPGPSSKIARTTVEQTSSPESVHVGDEECQTGQMPSAQPAAGPPVEDPQSTVFETACQPSTSSSTVPALDEGASTSLGASGRLAPLMHERDPPQKHPFVRRPVLQPGVEAPPFSSRCLKHTYHAPRDLCLILRIMRELFRKKELDLAGACNLVFTAQELARLAYVGMTVDVSRFKPVRAVEYLGDAIEQLKSGNPLPEDVVVDLKRNMLCSGNSPSRFKASSWDPWRDDDRESPN
ncbi:hypothetical protein Esti_006738 [Eimeria stiedai]